MNDESVAAETVAEDQGRRRRRRAASGRLVPGTMRRAPFCALSVYEAVIFLGILVALFVSASNATGANPESTNYCRNALGDVVVCNDCPPTPPTAQVPYCDIDNQPRFEKYQVPGCKFNTRADVGADEFYAWGCEPYGYLVVPITTMQLRLVSQTASTITLGWDPPPGTDGYRFTRSDQAKRSHTWNGARNEVVFGKGAPSYKVETLRIGQTGTYAP